MGAQGGSKDRKGKRNMVIGVGCQFEMKGDAKVDEKVCMMSDKKTVVPLPARNVGGPAEAARCAFNDAMLVRATVQNIDERARSDFHLLSRCLFLAIYLCIYLNYVIFYDWNIILTS